MSLLNSPFDPAREAALVTGAGNGIGRAIAQALVGEGVNTVFADLCEDTVAAARGRSRLCGQPRDLAAEACGQPRRRLSSGARTRAKADRGPRARLVSAA